MEERAYEWLPDGSIGIDGLNIEAHINSRGIVYDADGVEFGELTEDRTKVVLWKDRFEPIYEVEIYPGHWIESDGSDLYDDEENPLETRTQKGEGIMKLKDLVDSYGETGVIRDDAGNGSAGPAWIEWDEDTQADWGNIEMVEAQESAPQLRKIRRYVTGEEEGADVEMFVSEWIEDDDPGATNPYRYRVIF